MKRICNFCQQSKPIDQFFKQPKNKCKDCVHEHQRRYRETKKGRDSANTAARKYVNKNKDCPEHRKRLRHNSKKHSASPKGIHSGRMGNIKKNYGLEETDLHNLLDRQKGLCALCQADLGATKYHIDHCHETGRVRGLLCPGCNMKLGGYEAMKKLEDQVQEYINE